MLTQKLDAEVRAIFNDWIAREEPKLRGAFDALSARFWSQTQQRVDDLLHRCSELFRVPLEAVESASLWRYESRFGYKFWSEPTSLSILSSSAPLALPRAIGDPLMLRQLRSTAMQLIDMHAGRLRSDIEERLRQSVESFRTRLLTSTTTIVDRIEEAVVRGKHQYARNKSQMSARDAQIVNCIVRIDAIATRVRRVA
jgi:hypothetical protein